MYLSGHIMKAQRYVIKLQTGFSYENKVHKALLNKAKIVNRIKIFFLALSCIFAIFGYIQDKAFIVSLLLKYSGDCSISFMNQRVHIDNNSSPAPLSILWGDFLNHKTVS